MRRIVMRTAVVACMIVIFLFVVGSASAEHVYHERYLVGTSDNPLVGPKLALVRLIGPDEIATGTVFNLTLEILPDGYEQEKHVIQTCMKVFLIAEDDQITLWGLRNEEAYYDGAFHEVPIPEWYWQLAEQIKPLAIDQIVALSGKIGLFVKTGSFIYKVFKLSMEGDYTTADTYMKAITTMNQFDSYPIPFDVPYPDRRVCAVRFTLPVIINQLNTPISFNIQDLKVSKDPEWPGGRSWGFGDGCVMTLNPAVHEELPGPELLSPPNHSINPTRPFEIRWSPVQDATRYTLWFNFGGIHFPIDMAGATAFLVTEELWTNLPDKTVYFWWVTCSNDTCESEQSEVWSITRYSDRPDNEPPCEPSSPSPADGETNVSTNEQLRWTGGDPDGDAVWYQVHFGSNSPPPYQDTVSDAQYSPRLSESRTYYWKITAMDQNGGVTEGPTWTFTTPGEPEITLDLQLNGHDFYPGDTKDARVIVTGHGYTVETYLLQMYQDGRQKYAYFPKGADQQPEDPMKFSETKRSLTGVQWDVHDTDWLFNRYTYGSGGETETITWKFWYEEAGNPGVELISDTESFTFHASR